MNTHTDAEIPKGREKEKRNERKKHIINLKNHEYKMPRSKKESKYQIIKTHRLQIPSWRNIQKKKKIKTRNHVTDTKSHKNIKQPQTRKGEGEKQQNRRITPSNQKITNRKISNEERKGRKNKIQGLCHRSQTS